MNETNVGVRTEDFTSYLSRVFLMMFLGIGLTAIVAVLTSHNMTLLRLAMQLQSGVAGTLVLLAVYVGLSLVLRGALAKANIRLAVGLYLLYAGITGFTWSVLGLIYDVTAIWQAFMSAAVFFGLMTIYALNTKRDLSSWGRYLIIAVVAVLISSLLNVFLFRSGTADLIFSLLGVVLFAGLTAFDVQKIKNFYAASQGDVNSLAAMGVYSAFMLYLDFINLFLYLLRIFGRQRD
ncbi:MAG: Bax inhibitor-1/YccA family protein [Peptoniphilaceae bacterium]|nr:Bax inhibitor-1/YccA family protein [Peptoniphilaceae bacterium]MCI6660188.1 Bax inhibitor-1/YccA family protein [Peptoniphilaceae bacterium]MDD7434213.1 Bax inhibitor-1/YccA family protein [Peptoniphilaceae bacterium]MDY3075309.1 Bax inhibitor-1/YccA family protein [Peptoniphilaceae bacterium]MDY4195652.1 Bax inhibitor-1/YccA family protein [Peptoniphilaceae bacterium]